VRAPFVAAWLRQLGHQADVLVDGEAARAALHSAGVVAARKPGFDASRIGLKTVTVADVAGLLASKRARVIDLRPSVSYRDGHIPGSVWSIRPRIAGVVSSGPVVLVADDLGVAALAALDLGEAGISDVAVLTGGIEAWKGAGHAVEASPSLPADADCIDFIFHTLGRNEGNLDAARAYLAWEVNLVGQLDADERASFRL
jgi:cystathionine beta-lyase